MPLTVILVIISFPSPTLCFIPYLKPFLQILPTAAFLFLLQDLLYTIPQTVTVTSEHIRFYFLVFLFYTF